MRAQTNGRQTSSGTTFKRPHKANRFAQHGCDFLQPVAGNTHLHPFTHDRLFIWQKVNGFSTLDEELRVVRWQPDPYTTPVHTENDPTVNEKPPGRLPLRSSHRRAP